MGTVHHLPTAASEPVIQPADAAFRETSQERPQKPKSCVLGPLWKALGRLLAKRHENSAPVRYMAGHHAGFRGQRRVRDHGYDDALIN